MQEEYKVDVLSNAKALPPHAPADMMNMYMTRYDYDYNREGCGDSQYTNTLMSDGNNAETMSGDVRNRPIEQYGQEWNGNTIYRQDYTAKSRYSMKDSLPYSLCDKDSNSQKNKTGLPLPTSSNSDSDKNTTAYTKFYYRAGLTPNATADGCHPESVYKVDYCADALRSLPLTNKTDQQQKQLQELNTNTSEVPLYAGARGVPYNASLLTVKGVQEDDGADITPKITQEVSLLPWRKSQINKGNTFQGSTTNNNNNNSSSAKNLLPSRRSLLHFWNLGNDDDGINDKDYTNTCTSWDYGDTSQAHPLQLPQGIDGSIAEAALFNPQYTGNPAELLRVLANQAPVKSLEEEEHEFIEEPEEEEAEKDQSQSANASHNARNDLQYTNPVYIARNEQPKCAIRHRIENEGFVQRTTYHTDYINQRRLPELPGNFGENGRVADTHTSPLNTAGEMTAGSTTKMMQEMGQLRNSHGTLKNNSTINQNGESARYNSMITTMRAKEKLLAVDKADPHRHKLHEEEPDIV